MRPLVIQSHLSQPVQAIFWMLGSGFFFSCLNAEIRYLSDYIHPFETAFFRNFFGLVFMLPWLFRAGLGGLRTSRIGFLGVLIIARPEAVGLSLGVALAIGSSVISAAITLIVKRLSRTESSSAIVTYMVLIMTPMSLVPALFVWQTPPLAIWPYLVATGMFGTAGHLCYVRAFRMADASAVLPFDYGRMLFAAIIGYYAFSEIPDQWTWIGSGVIAAASFYIARREAMLNRQAAAITTARAAELPSAAGR